MLDPADYTDEKVFIEDVKTKFIDFFDHVHHLYEGRQEASAARLWLWSSITILNY